MTASPNAALRDYSLLWRAALATRHRHANKVLCLLALLSSVVLFGLVLGKTGDPVEAVLIGGRAVWVVLGFGWMMYFVPGALKLNTPANARLVPRMTRRLRQLVVMAWATATALSALLAAGSPIPVQLAFLGTGYWLITFGLARGGKSVGNWLQFLLPMTIVLHTSIPHGWLAALAQPLPLAVATLLMLALGAYTLEIMFPHEGERHLRLQAAQKLVADQMSIAGQSQQVLVPRPFQWAYRAVLRRDCARRDADALMLHVLGPNVHTSQRTLAVVTMTAIAAVAVGVAHRFMGTEALAVLASGSWAFLASALMVQLFDYERRLLRLSFTRGEQGLVRLAPAVPAAPREFNRRLAAMLLRCGLTEWASLSAAILGIMFLTGATADFLLMQASVCCLTLPTVASLLRDHAHRSGSAGWRMLVGGLVSAAGSVGVGLLAHQLLDTPVMPVAALASVAFAIAAVNWRWRRLVDAPHAFPVGRLA